MYAYGLLEIIQNFLKVLNWVSCEIKVIMNNLYYTGSLFLDCESIFENKSSIKCFKIENPFFMCLKAWWEWTCGIVWSWWLVSASQYQTFIILNIIDSRNEYRSGGNSSNHITYFSCNIWSQKHNYHMWNLQKNEYKELLRTI